jgi:N6-adenosine-specific RNA methylase IME4
MTRPILDHSFSALVPRSPADEYQMLKQDIAAKGLLNPAIMFEGKVLDGRHRLRACRELGIEPRFETYKGNDPRGFVISQNVMRRHLSASQRAMVLAQMEALRPGGRSKDSKGTPLPQTAKLGRVALNTLKAARTVRAKGTPALQKAAMEDRIAAHIAAKATVLPPRTQDQIARADNPANALQRAHRAEKERILGRKQVAMPPGLFGVVLADPAWKFETWGESGQNRTAARHYPTMELEKIKALQVPAADVAVLFMWATGAMMPEALEVMEAWGFEYQSQIVWVKPRPITGHWARSRHELLLIGTRGKPPAPAPGTQPESVIEAPTGPHSEKPAIVYEIIEKMFPTMPKLELFARQKRKDWTSWGNEV